MTKDMGGPAFPQPIASTIDGHTFTTCDKDNAQSGMTLRDWFAGMALQGISAKTWSKALNVYPDKETNDKDLSEAAYRVADAMLKSRDASQKDTLTKATPSTTGEHMDMSARGDKP